MDFLEKMIADSKRQREQDALRFKELDSELCMCCHAYGEDKRSIWIDCFYEIKEVVPDAIDISGVEPLPENHKRGYYLRVCKSCRSRFLGKMQDWWEEGVDLRDLSKDHDGHAEDQDPTRNIPTRVNGALVMLTREEWDTRNPGREPVTF